MSLNEFAPWQCPLCGAPLAGDVFLKCARNHSFDRAKEGYWHLLPVQSMRTKAPGDSKEMVAARRAFLNAGYYGIFGQAAGQRFGELQVVHSVDEGETPGDVLGFVGLDVADAMPLHIEIGKGFLLGKRFLHVIFAKNPLSEPVCRENGLHWMELGYGNETYIFRLAPRDAGGPGEAPAHGFEAFPKRCCF